MTPQVFIVVACSLAGNQQSIIGSKRAGFACSIQICSKLTKEKDAGVKRAFEPDFVVEDIYDVLPVVKGLLEGK